MNSATALEYHDRCLRSAFLSRKWQRNVLHPTAALYLAIEEGLTYAGTEDAGQYAGDHLMTLAVERGLDSPQSDLFGLATHLAAIADLVTWLMRPTGEPWGRPENVKVGEATWESSAFLNEAGTRLRRVVLVDRWSDERELAEGHSWRTCGETAAYQMPLDQTILVIGQNRQGRRHGPFSKAWLHPVNDALRMRKRDGKGFSGDWKPVFREEWDGSREKWLDVMTTDGVLEDAVFHIEVPVSDEAEKIRRLASKKMEGLANQETLPDPQPSQCDGISPCQFREACWSFKPPSVQLGFVRIA